MFNIYQRIIRPLIISVTGTTHACRFHPTCSVYSKESIKLNGLIIGGVLSIIRVLRCNPLSKPGHYPAKRIIK